MVARKSATTPAEADDLVALVAQAKRIADALEVYTSAHSKLVICGHEAQDGTRCLRAPNHAPPHTNVPAQSPKIWVDATSAPTPPIAAIVECDACGMIGTHDPTCGTLKATVNVPVASVPVAATPLPNGTKVTFQTERGSGTGVVTPEGIATHGQEVAALVTERTALADALGAELAAKVAVLGDKTQDPGLALEVKQRAVALLGEDGFKAARTRQGLKAGACPAGAELRRFAIEALAPVVSAGTDEP